MGADTFKVVDMSYCGSIVSKLPRKAMTLCTPLELRVFRMTGGDLYHAKNVRRGPDT